MSTTEPTEEMVEAAARAAWEAIPEHGSWDSVSTLEWADVRTQIRAALRAALAVAPAPSDDDREALARIDDAIKRVPKLGGAGAIYEAELLDVLRCARGALARRSPVSPPEDVTALLAEANEHRFTVGPDMGICAADGVHGTPLGDVLRAEAALVQRLAAAFRAPVPVETEPAHVTVTASPRQSGKVAEMVERILDRANARGVMVSFWETVTTIEELDALPVGSVVQHARIVDFLLPDVSRKEEDGWYTLGWYDESHNSAEVKLPARVLFRPSREETR